MVVVDASVVAALFVADERQEEVHARMTRWIRDAEPLHAPSVLPYELSNVLARQSFDGLLNQDDATQIWSDVTQLGIALHPFDPILDGSAVAAITSLLRRRHATDSHYIWIAQLLGTVVWTLDGKIARNAAAVGLPVALLA